jgi:hypothetical protein
VSAENSDPERPKRIGRPFEKGQSGNPGGRPKLLREFQDWLEAEAYPEAKKALLDLLSSDNAKAKAFGVREVYDRLFGKPPQAITGDDGGPLRVEHGLDLSKLTVEQLEQLRAIVRSAK